MMYLVSAQDALGETVRRMGTSSLDSARRWQAEFLAELDSGTVTIDEAEALTPIRRITTARITQGML